VVPDTSGSVVFAHTAGSSGTRRSSGARERGIADHERTTIGAA
jgi:hypothetical protein